MAGTILTLSPPRRGDPLALHAQISEQIRAAISSGALQPGDQLPPEAEVARQTHVARLTVRQSLDILAREGLIERRHGVGTFVREITVSARRTEHLTEAAKAGAGEASLIAANVRAEAIRLRQEAQQLRAEMAELRLQLQQLLGGGVNRPRVPAPRRPASWHHRLRRSERRRSAG